MKVWVDQQAVTLKDTDLLGEGGEARVYRWHDLALKIFHDAPSTGLALKVAKLKRFPAGLPASVVVPGWLALNTTNDVVGYAMPRVDGAEPVGRLANRAWRQGRHDNTQVTALFAHIANDVRSLHARHVVIGDFNDGNVLFRGPQPFFIDTDSMQFGGLPCVVGHERFLDPRLYGIDLTARACFTEASDWYAWAVMFFSSLLGVHPFGGIHPKLPTLLRRAEARRSVFQPDVTWPRVAAPSKVLPDDALQWFSSVFERDVRTAPPVAVTSLQWTVCRCGVEFATAACPACHALGPLSTRPVAKVVGRCVARIVVQTPGRVVAAALQGGLRYALEENGMVRREDGSVVLSAPLGSARVFISGASTWVAHRDGRVQRIVDGEVAELFSTSLRGGEPVFAASALAAYRQENEWLVDALTGLRMGQVLEGQTWLATGERLGLGFYRAGGFTNAFLLRTGRPGLRRLPDVTWTGKVLDVHAAFDANHVLLTVVVARDGRDVVHRWLHAADGALLGFSRSSTPGTAALLNGQVVVATDAGLMRLSVRGGALVETAVFSDTQPLIDATDVLLPNSDGSLTVVGARDITQLSLS
ncbi:MAG: hypothetical protein JNG84_10980 [Archangium sp.]|nr:hypothetical protein [Archangium sp.]